MAPMAVEIGFDLSLFAARSVGDFIRVASAAPAIDGGDGRVAKLEESVKSLEEERRKIEAFQRELPLCMNLISDVIEELKKELERWQGQRFSGVSGEFVPAKGKSEEGKRLEIEDDCKEKMNWLSSVQLWSNNNSEDNTKGNNTTENKIAEERNGRTPDRKSESEKFFSNSKPQSCVGAFLPFKGLPVMTSAVIENNKPTMTLSGLSLTASASATATKPKEKIEENSTGGLGLKYMSRAPVSAPSQATLQIQQQNQRKARRCWSKELHHRFLCALEELGGPHVATPKQIREVMKVDGLTNDEVKSHLQKYRLHMRRAPSSSSYANHRTAATEHTWESSEKSVTIFPPHSVSHSGSPASPLHLALSERAVSTTGGDSCEDEDGRPEVYSGNEETCF